MSSRRREPRRFELRRGTLVAAAAFMLLLVVAYSVNVAPRQSPADSTALKAVPAQASVAVGSPKLVSASASMPVEVPTLVGMSVREAGIVLAAAGLVGETVSKTPSKATVTSQSPAPGSVERSGSSVTLLTTGDTKPKGRGDFVVCLDPGHQQHADTTPEPVRPGSKKPKPRVSAGTTGVRTGLPEYEIALQIAMNVKAHLERSGIKVVMTRTTNDVNLSNKERARFANKAKADLFVRIHGNGSPDPSDSGIATLYPARRSWTRRIAKPSKEAALLLQNAVVAETGAVDRGVIARDDLAGFNFATVPSVLIECGYLSNPIEDRLLASPHYQDSLAKGISAGILNYLAQGE